MWASALYCRRASGWWFRRRRGLAFVVSTAAIAVALGVIFPGAVGAKAGAAVQGQWIGAVAFSDGRAVRVVRADGSRVTLAIGEGARPQGWSPDGSALLVVDERGLRSVHADGAPAAVLSRRPDVRTAEWSRDGRRVAFVAGFGKAGEKASGLWVADADGSELRWIARLADPYHSVRGITWAPDSTTVIFASRLFRTFGLFSVRVAGRAPHQIRVIRYQHPPGSLPKWSPDGSLLLFAGIQGPSAYTYVMRPDGSNPRRLRECGNPSWSPDGTRIACITYSRRHPFHVTIAVMDRAGTLHNRIAVQGAGVLGGPAWSPDGKALAYTFASPFGGPPGNPGVYVARLDNRTSNRIVPSTPGRVAFNTPQWRPHPTAHH